MKPGLPICVLSLHPTRDVILDVPGLELGGVNRAREWFSYPAGKALNCARTVGMLGGRAQAIVFAPGNWAGILRGFLGGFHVRHSLIPVGGEGRVCVMLGEGRRETVINTDLKMHPTPAQKGRLLRLIRAAARRGGFLVASGSLPPTMSDANFLSILRSAKSGRARLVLDVSGARLRAGVRERPWLIKPNLREFSGLVGRCPRPLSALARLASGLRARGVGRVLLSLGSRGCLLSSPQGDWFVPAVPVRSAVLSPVGCGDALLGGFLRAVAGGAPEREALRWGVAAATANLARPGACLMSPGEIRAVLPRVRPGRIP